MSNTLPTHSSSYRDPSGFIFEKEGVLYRQVNKVFSDDFDLFINSGCYQSMVDKGILVPHETVQQNLTGSAEWYRTLKPEKIAVISYPYEWSFDMLKDAALLTLRILKEALNFGLVLKDATPYNVQWHKGKLVFIDTLSFEKYNPDEPWIAYRQYCECFLSPLLLMHYTQQSLHRLSLAYPEGIPLALTKSLLPWRTKFSLHTYLHIHLHGGVAQKKPGAASRPIHFSKQKLLNLVNSLESLTKKLKTPQRQTTWSAYYEEAAQRDDYLAQKKKIIEEWIDKAGTLRSGADLGANEGEFSRLLSTRGIPTVAADFDPLCINNLYQQIRKNKEDHIQPVIIDLADPSPSIGVNNKERDSFMERLQVDMLMALALVHHLAIGKNIPFSMIGKFFSSMTNQFIFEFVPKDDPKVKEMLQQKKDIYTDYTQDRFEEEMKKFFSIQDKKAIPGTGRVLYFFKKN